MASAAVVAGAMAGFATPVSAAPGPSVIATIGLDAHPSGVAVDPVTNKVYVTAINSGSVSVIDGATNAVTAEVSAGLGPGLTAIGVNPATDRIYVDSSGAMAVIDGATNLVLASNISLGSEPGAIAVNPDTNTVYVANHDGTGISVIDGASFAADPSIPLVADLAGLGVNPATDTVYGVSNGVQVIDAATGTETASFGAGNIPDAVGVDQDTNTIYVPNEADGSVSVIDGATNTVTDTINDVGNTPYAVAVDPSTDTIYVANANGNNVSVIDGATDTVTATVGVGLAPLALDVDPATHLVYVANQESNTVSVIAGTTTVSTATTLTASPHPAQAGQPVALTAAVTAADGSNPAGSVQFEAGGTIIGGPVTVSGGAATTTTTFAAAGLQSLSAVFTPDNTAGYSSSAGPLALTVQAAQGSSGAIQLAATVPALGSFTLAIAPGVVTLTASGSDATGALNPITVTDTRNTYPGWSVSGQAADFTGSGSATGYTIPGDRLGWTPTDTSLATGATVGPTVGPGSPGLGSTAGTLASATAGGGLGTSLLGANLTLAIPPTAVAGPYDSTLTVTAVTSLP